VKAWAARRSANSLQFIVSGEDKTAKRASKAMGHSELVATAITVRGEIWGIGHNGESDLTHT